MVCVPCIVIPVLLWIFHKFIQPIILKFWNPWASKSVSAPPDAGGDSASDTDLLKSEQYQYIQKMASEHPVIIFSKTTCSYSAMAKNLLNEIGVDYEVEEIDRRSDTDKLQDIFLKITSARTVPRVFIGGKCVGGGSETWSLHNQNRLIPLLKDAGATFKKTD